MIVFLAHPAGFGRKKSVKDTVGDDGLRLIRSHLRQHLRRGLAADRISKPIGGCAHCLPVRFAPKIGRSFRQEAIGAPRSKRLVKRDQNPLSFLSKCEQPCIGPKFGRCRSPRGFLTKPLLYLWGLGGKRYTVVFVQAVVDAPCCGDRQRLAVHHRSRRHET